MEFKSVLAGCQCMWIDGRWTKKVSDALDGEDERKIQINKWCCLLF